MIAHHIPIEQSYVENIRPASDMSQSDPSKLTVNNPQISVIAL